MRYLGSLMVCVLTVEAIARELISSERLQSHIQTNKFRFPPPYFNSIEYLLIMIVYFSSVSPPHVGFKVISGTSIRSRTKTVETAPSVYPDSPDPSTLC